MCKIHLDEGLHTVKCKLVTIRAPHHTDFLAVLDKTRSRALYSFPRRHYEGGYALRSKETGTICHLTGMLKNFPHPTEQAVAFYWPVTTGGRPIASKTCPVGCVDFLKIYCTTLY
jgi:hypothetical protein